MKMFALAILGLAMAVCSAPVELEGQALVDYINANSKTWKAADFDEFKMEDRLMTRESSMLPVEKRKLLTRKPVISNDFMPYSFDARTKWPNCTTISKIRDQSNCGSCWAVSSASVITDRTCIFSNQSKNDDYSALDILSCRLGKFAKGCFGGATGEAFEYWIEKGLVSGSTYAENGGCKPYPFPSCGGSVVRGTKDNIGDGGRITKCTKKMFTTPKCYRKCQDSYQTPYTEDRTFGEDYSIIFMDPTYIQQEIYKNGPVVANFEVYSDFRKYKSGVYQHTTGKFVGIHAAKIIGWGNENEVDYWLAVNSWGPNWGDNGYFKIIRGNNECSFEDDVHAPIPKRPDSIAAN